VTLGHILAPRPDLVSQRWGDIFEANRDGDDMQEQYITIIVIIVIVKTTITIRIILILILIYIYIQKYMHLFMCM
jgi:hypothetical protein